jgi:hypothetical protein
MTATFRTQVVIVLYLFLMFSVSKNNPEAATKLNTCQNLFLVLATIAEFAFLICASLHHGVYSG